MRRAWRSPRAAREPVPTRGGRCGYLRLVWRIVRVRKKAPLYTGRVGVRRGRTRDQAPSAPMMRS